MMNNKAPLETDAVIAADHPPQGSLARYLPDTDTVSAAEHPVERQALCFFLGV